MMRKIYCILYVSLLIICISTGAYASSYYMAYKTNSSIELYSWDWDGDSTFTNPELVNSFSGFGVPSYQDGIALSFGPDNTFYMAYKTNSSVELYTWDWDGDSTFTNPELVNSFSGFGVPSYQDGIALSFGPDNTFYMAYKTNSSVELYTWDWDGDSTFTNPELVNSFSGFGLPSYQDGIALSFGPDNTFYMAYKTNSSVELYRWDWDGNETFTNPELVNSFSGFGLPSYQEGIALSIYPVVAIPEPATLLLSGISIAVLFRAKRNSAHK